MIPLKKTDVYVGGYVFIPKGPREQGFPISKVRPHDIDITSIAVDDMLFVRRPVGCGDKAIYFLFYITTFHINDI
ncbi:hypothetical protein C6503_19795 [Candidatus Poribacteria bacterium]|nr:MAG: hypothetical protein C6503_19795 [Candidatus Poribacteria bacterium]